MTCRFQLKMRMPNMFDLMVSVDGSDKWFPTDWVIFFRERPENQWVADYYRDHDRTMRHPVRMLLGKHTSLPRHMEALRSGTDEEKAKAMKAIRIILRRSIGDPRNVAAMHERTKYPTKRRFYL